MPQARTALERIAIGGEAGGQGEDRHEEPAEHEDHAGHQDEEATLAPVETGDREQAPGRFAAGRAGQHVRPLVGGAQEDRSTDRRPRGLEAEDARGEDGASLPPRGEDDQRGEHEDGGRDGDPDRPPGAGSGVRGRTGDDPPLCAARDEQERRDEADPAQGAHEQRAQVPTRSRRWVRTWNPVRRATRVSAVSSSCSTAADTSKSVTSPQDEQIRWWWWCVRSSASS